MGEKCAPGAEREDFTNGAQRLVKAPFLAQIDFSWSKDAKNKNWPREKYWSVVVQSQNHLGGGGGGGKLELLGEKLPPASPQDRTMAAITHHHPK